MLRPCLRCGIWTDKGAYCSRHSKRTVRGRKWSGRAWEEIRQRALRRDGYRCSIEGCPNTRLEVDHIVPLEEGGTDDLGNLRTLCRYHHQEVHR